MTVQTELRLILQQRQNDHLLRGHPTQRCPIAKLGTPVPGHDGARQHALSKLVLFVIGSPAQFRNRFRSLSTVNRSGSQNASKNAAAAAEKTE